MGRRPINKQVPQSPPPATGPKASSGGTRKEPTLRSTGGSETVALMKIIKKSEPGAILFDSVPQEFLQGSHIDLSRWSVILTDESLKTMAENDQRGDPYYFVDAGKPAVPLMFHSFFEHSTEHLTALNISGAKEVSDYGMTLISRNCRNLSDLNINGCIGITDVGLREVALNCAHLEMLVMASCHTIEGGGLVSIAECCPKLRKLDMSHCRRLQRWGISKICYLSKKMEDFNVSYLNVIGDEEIRVLSQTAPNLTNFTAVDAVNLSDNAIMNIAMNCQDIDYINVSRTDMSSKITDVSLGALGKHSHSLQVLLLSGCDYITDVGLNWLAEGCPALAEIDLTACNKITDAGLRGIGSHCHSLTAINITGCKIVSDVGISSVTSGCPILKRLVCGGLYLLSDPRITPAKRAEADQAWQPVIGIAALAVQCKELEHLDVHGCFRLNQVLEHDIAQNLDKIVSLNLSGCNTATAGAFGALAQGCPNLKTIVFSDCPGVTGGSMHAFAKYCKHMRLVSLCRCRNLGAAAVKAIAQFEFLEKLDISGCTALVDSDMLPLCSVDNALRLNTLVVNGVKYLTDSGMAWIATARTDTLRHFSFKGTSITRQSAQAVRDLFPYSDLVCNENFHGFWPKTRMHDRLLINKYHLVCMGITKIQARVRKVIAKIFVSGIAYRRRIQRAALKITMSFRIKQAKRVLREKRAAWKLKNKKAVIVTSLFHMAVAKYKVKMIKLEILKKLRYDQAVRIQRAFRVYREKKTVQQIRQAYLALIRKRRRAQIILQSGSRMWAAMEKVAHIKEYIRATKALRQRKAIMIQRVFRGHEDRCLARAKKAELELIHITNEESATKIQRRWRNSRTNNILKVAKEMRRRRELSAIKAQSVMRGKLARWKHKEMQIEKDDRIRHEAAIRMQTRLRMLHAKILVNRLLVEKRELIRRQTKASLTFSCHWRGRNARMIIKELRRQRDEDIRQQVLLEMWAVGKIQACFRGMRGRIRFDEILKEKKGKWKELMDETKGRRFFYNKLTGEIRWRMPKDLLDLIPRPKCDNCSKFEAGVECAICDEVFCHTCWESIHHAGRRKDHEFRVLYDYYGKRIDYGDGVFPCKWSTEVMQDEIQGWMLRVAPIRDPAVVYGDWEYYADDSTIAYNPSLNIDASKAFYFNRKNFETCYDMPIDVARAIAAEEELNNTRYSEAQDLDWTAQTGDNVDFSHGYSDQWGQTGNSLHRSHSFNEWSHPSPAPHEYTSVNPKGTEDYPLLTVEAYNDDYNRGGGDQEPYYVDYELIEEDITGTPKPKTMGFNIRRKKPSPGKKLKSETMRL